MVKQLTVERRKALRAKRILSIQYRLLKSRKKNAESAWHLSTTYDMSILGISFLSEVPYAIDDTLEIQVIMSGIIDIFTGYAKVVRIERKETGAFYLIAVKFVKSPAKRPTKIASKSSRLGSAVKKSKRK